jgi:hypothetical protein
MTDALADEDLRVPAADGGEAQEARVLDMGDDEPDLVDVADDGHARPPAVPATRAVDEPIVSTPTSANSAAASRQTVAGAVS